jgi:transposase-like protein
MVTTYLGKTVDEYRQNYLEYLSQIEFVCPICKEPTRFHGFYSRKVKIDNENKEELIIARVKCTSCERTHAILPDFIAPYKHYSAVEIEKVVEHADSGVSAEQIETPAEISTVRRWVRNFRNKAKEAIGALKSIAYEIYGRSNKLLDKVNLSRLTMLKKALELFPEIDSACNWWGRTNIWLMIFPKGIFI